MGAEKYNLDDNCGTLYVRPITVRMRATIAAGGGSITKSTTRRQSDPDAVMAGSGGTYTITGLPKGSDYHISGCHLVTATDPQTVFVATVSTFSASAGTLTVLTRVGAGGAVGNVSASTDLHLTIDVETGLYT